MGRSHMASGALTGVGVSYLTDASPAIAVGFTAIVTVAALLPDFDHPNATGPRYLGWPGQLVAAVIGAFFGHRGLTHSFLGLGALTLALAFVPGLPFWAAAAVVTGCVVHIIGDMLTVSGVPLFWPADQRFRIGWMRAGGHFETLVVFPLLVTAASVVGAAFVLGKGIPQ